MRRLLAATSLTPIAIFASAIPASAETVISTATTAPVKTSTANDDLRISSAGSVTLTSGVAVTMDSNDSVKNEGTVSVTGGNGSTGILVNGNLAGNVTNTKVITLDENYTPTDTDNDGDVDGAFSLLNGRYGIHVLAGTHTGNIVDDGTMLVEGNNSAGIAVDGTLAGNFTQTGGSIGVVGNNSYGLHLNDVTGSVKVLNGSIGVKGANSVGLALDGDIGGAVVIQGAVTSTGYRSNTAPADASKLDADDLLQGGPAVRIAGNVAGGVLLDVRPADNSTTDTDEDDDGILDANEGNASFTVFGSAPALMVGASGSNITIGALASSSAGHGIVSKATIAAAGVYEGVNSTAVQIGGAGGTVNIANGITLGGELSASAVKANSTALLIGTGASVPVLVTSATIGSLGGGTASTGATGVKITSGAALPTIKNSGTITAKVNGTQGTGTAIIDESGTLALIENTGTISVVNAATLGTKAVAFDLSANTAGATVRNLAATGAGPTIAGTMKFGSGSDVLDVADGVVIGDAAFGMGANQLKLSGDGTMTGKSVFGSGNDLVSLAGTSKLTGDIDFGGGADALTVAGTAVYRGKLTNASGAVVSVGDGATLALTNLGSVAIDSLTVGNGSKIGVSIDSTAGTFTKYVVTNGASFGTGSVVAVDLTSVAGSAGTYTIVDAGSLTGATNLSATVATLPFLYTGELAVDAPNNEIDLVIRQKTAAELDLNASEGSALSAILAAADTDSAIAPIYLGVSDVATLQDLLQQSLPEHAGGTFENVTRASRLTTHFLSDPDPIRYEAGKLSFMLQQVAWGRSKSIGSTSSYKVSGWGASGGVETALGIGHAGLQVSYLAGKDERVSNGEARSNQYEGALYFRGGNGPLRGFARVAIGRVGFEQKRIFSGSAGGNTITREVESDWKGTLTSGLIGAYYDLSMGRLSVRPTLSLDYFRLNEKGYTESGGGTALDLTVDDRKSTESAVNGTLAIGYKLIDRPKAEDGWMRIELEGGRRQLVGGTLGATTARFAGGQSFALSPEERESAWIGRLRVAGGGLGISLAGEVDAEQMSGRASIAARLGVRLGL